VAAASKDHGSLVARRPSAAARYSLPAAGPLQLNPK
jgi:hypothetical protein